MRLAAVAWGAWPLAVDVVSRGADCTAGSFIFFRVMRMMPVVAFGSHQAHAEVARALKVAVHDSFGCIHLANAPWLAQYAAAVLERAANPARAKVSFFPPAKAERILGPDVVASMQRAAIAGLWQHRGGFLHLPPQAGVAAAGSHRRAHSAHSARSL